MERAWKDCLGPAGGGRELEVDLCFGALRLAVSGALTLLDRRTLDAKDGLATAVNSAEGAREGR